MATYYTPEIIYTVAPRPNTTDRQPWEYLRDAIDSFENQQRESGNGGSFDRSEAERWMLPVWQEFVAELKKSGAIGCDLITDVRLAEEEVSDE